MILNMARPLGRFSFWVAALLSISQRPTEAAPKEENLEIAGLEDSVEIIKDRWGISHIYAKNQRDLFFAQGFNVARDRLFQLEMWRRKATGTLAEILGERAAKSDAASRLLKLRVDMKQELNHYHPDGEEIVTSFVRGINAYVDLTKNNPELLPMEFGLLGIEPHHWTPEVVVSRHNGLYRNVTSELAMARRVAAMGGELVSELADLHPGKPQLVLDPAIDVGMIPSEVFDAYRAARSFPKFLPSDIVDPSKRAEDATAMIDKMIDKSFGWDAPDLEVGLGIGSNNWTVSGDLTFSRRPIMANDPHRGQQTPSLRYWVHLVAPGWNVIGGGEPSLPGVSIGHNEHGAWGLTIFSIDQEDLYVYDTNPENVNEYRYRGVWEDMRLIEETIAVKDAPSVKATLKYTRHGPVLYEDPGNHKAYALRAAWLEIGAAPYLASLRIDQAKSWEEFREACSYSRTPAENMVWAGVDGDIGWQAVGITPIRRNWYGLMPVPGDGRYEWAGYLPIKQLPHLHNPPEGYVATANEDNIPHGYPHRLGFAWSDASRSMRIKEVLESGRKLTMMDMMQLQHDELSIPARTLVPLLKGLRPEDPQSLKAMEKLLKWDYVMDRDSVEAAIFSSWRARLMSEVGAIYLPETFGNVGPRPSQRQVIDLLISPDGRFGEDPTADRDALLLGALAKAVGRLESLLGPDMNDWRYGQAKFHHIRIEHVLSSAVSQELRAKLNLGPLPRGGSANTPNSTGNGGNQRSGASFRLIADTGDWDNSVGTNNPGQSGDPDSPHYADLFEMWANNKYFPVLYSRGKVESVAELITMLLP